MLTFDSDDTIEQVLQLVKKNVEETSNVCYTN